MILLMSIITSSVYANRWFLVGVAGPIKSSIDLSTISYSKGITKAWVKHEYLQDSGNIVKGDMAMLLNYANCAEKTMGTKTIVPYSKATNFSGQSHNLPTVDYESLAPDSLKEVEMLTMCDVTNNKINRKGIH